MIQLANNIGGFKLRSYIISEKMKEINFYKNTKCVHVYNQTYLYKQLVHCDITIPQTSKNVLKQIL